MTDFRRTIALGFGALALANLGLAQQWNEAANGGGDAGETLVTAQVCAGTNALTSIRGTHTFDDCDMYLVEIFNPGSFSAAVASDANFDTQLFLFDMNGFGVTHHDDVSSTNRRSRLTNQFVTEAGRYYLAINADNRHAFNNLEQRIWNSTPSLTERAPDGPGAAGELAYWSDDLGGADDGGVYTINLAGCRYINNPIPCPGNLDNDGDVDLQDLATLLANFGRLDNPSGAQGNIDGDGDVDLQDLSTLLANFGRDC